MRMTTAKLCLTLFFITILSVGSLQAQYENSLEGDFRALMDLYESTNGDGWYDRTGWTNMTPQTMGEAVGIEVNSAGRVISIDMQKVTTVPPVGAESGPQHNGNNLTGILPASLGNLKKVTYFNVKQNKIGGNIPPEIGFMESLEWLSLAGQRGDVVIGRDSNHDYRGQGGGKAYEETNSFSGNIPAELGNLSNLKVFECRRQFLTGTIPPELGKWTKIKMVLLNHHVGDNSLGGELPPQLSGWGATIQTLDLSNEGRTSSRNVEDYNYGLGFTGEVPQEILDAFTTEDKSYINLSSNSFIGDIPIFSNLKDIRVLKLRENNFTGNFPIGYFNKGYNANIFTFTVEDNSLSGEIPDGMVPPEFPTSRPNYNNISSFKIGGNSFSGSIPGWVQEINSHVQINFSSIGFTGAFPKKLAEQPNVRLFFISNNEFSGDLPDVNWNSNSLYGVTMSSNNFTGPIPESWSSMTQGERGVWRLYMNSNELSGELPSWLSNMPKLEWLLLHNNRFTYKDILPHYDAILNNLQSNASAGRTGDGGEKFYIHDQKPFGKPKNRTMPLGGELVLDLSEYDYDGNRYQWLKDGAPMDGADSPVLILTDISSADEGEYVLRVTNPALPELESHSSEPITFQVGADDGLNSGKGSDNDGDNTGDGDNPAGSRIFPESPLLLGPVDNELNSSVTPEFRWAPVEGADYYKLHMSRNSPNGMVIDVIVEDTVYTHPEKLGDNSVHHWRVRAVKDGEPGEWSEIFELQTENAWQPQMADLVSPDHFTQNVSVSPRFEWGPVDSDLFEIRIIDKVTSETVLTDELSGYRYTPDNPLAEETVYIWQVKNVKDGIEGAWSPRWEFATGEYDYVMSSPPLLSPDNGGEYESLTPTFEWESIEADMYVISVSLEKPSKAKVLSEANQESTIIFEELPETYYTTKESLDPETTYYWRVKAIKNGEESDWSETWEFTTLVEETDSGDPDETPEQIVLSQNYPNPFNPTTQIEFTVAEPNAVSLKVYNLAGQLVATLVEGVVRAGRHTATFDASGLASGVYLYRFVSGSQQFTEKMTLVK